MLNRKFLLGLTISRRDLFANSKIEIRVNDFKIRNVFVFVIFANMKMIVANKIGNLKFC